MPARKYRATYFQEIQAYLRKFIDLRRVDLGRMPGFVYYAVDADLTIVKIGYSTSPEHRMTEINIGCDRVPSRRRLYLWSYYPGQQIYCFRTGNPALPPLLVEGHCHLLFLRYCNCDRAKVLRPVGSRCPRELFRLEGELRDFVLGMPRLTDPED